MSDYHRTEVGSSYRKDYLISRQTSVDACIWYDAYIKGYREPNYPMPAIRYDADWFPQTVCIFRIYTADDYELPEIVAKYFSFV